MPTRGNMKRLGTILDSQSPEPCHLRLGPILTLGSLYSEQAVRGFRAHSCYEAQLALALFRQGQVQAATGDVNGAEASFRETGNLYAKIAGGHENRSVITAERLESAVPLSSR